MTSMNTMRLSIRKNDTIQVISGREKGKTGKVLRVSAKTGRVTVEKLNMVKRHMKPSQQNPQGGIIEKEVPLQYSNVLLFCTKCNRGVRHGHKQGEEAASKGTKKAAGTAGAQKKVRVCKRCESTLESA